MFNWLITTFMLVGAGYISKRYGLHPSVGVFAYIAFKESVLARRGLL